jgi:uncharacterized protein YjbI with pentapeptide repeats
MIHTDKTYTGDELAGQQFVDARFSHCLFPDTNLKFTSFRNCTFTGCDLSGVILDGTNFTSCSFPECKLSNLNFFSVAFAKCDFSNAVMQNCVFEHLRAGGKSLATKFNLTSSKFADTDLTGSVFFLCDLTDAKFGRSRLERTTFDRCTLKRTDLTGATMDGIRFIDCKMENTILDVEGFISFGLANGFKLER